MKPIHRSRRGAESKCAYPGCTRTYRAYKGRKTSMCKTHVNVVANTSDEGRARRSEGLKRKWMYDPAWAARESARLSDARRRKLAEDPAQYERLVEHGRDLQRRYPTRGGDSEAQAERARRGWAKRLAHIPLEHRDEYFRLRKQGLRAEERARIIQELSEAEQRRYRLQVEQKMKGSK